MASSELTDLPATTTLAGDEVFYVVDDPAGTPLDRKITATNLIAATGLPAHLADTSDAHDASAVSFAPVGTITSTDAQSAIAEAAAETVAHITNTTSAHAASAIVFSPVGSISATDVQSAITEVAAEAGGGGAASTSSGLVITETVAAEKPLVVKGAASQTADLTEWQDSAGTVVARCNPAGAFSANQMAVGGNTGALAPYTSVHLAVQAGSDTLKPLVVRGAASQTANLQEWQATGGTVLGYVDAAGNVVVPAEAYGAGWNGSNAAPTKNDVYDKIEALPELTAAVPSEVSLVTSLGVTTIDLGADIARVADITSSTIYSTVLSATSTAVNNSTVLVNATGLSVALAASATYEVEGFILYRASATSDIKFGWTYPTGCTAQWFAGGVVAAATTTGEGDYRALGGDITTTPFAGAATVSATTVARPYGVFKTSTTAGTLQLQFAQNAADPTDCTIRANSFIKATRIA